MNSTAIFNLIQQIGSTSSKLEKQALVRKGIDEDVAFRMVLDWAYNPFKTYYIAAKTLDAITSPGLRAEGVNFDGTTIKLIEALYLRTISGHEAQAAIGTELDRLNDPSATLLRRILLKDLRAGFSESTINKAVPGLIPEFPYMRCSLPAKSNLAKFPWAEGVFSQEKADGMFTNVSVDESGDVSATTRQGSPIPVESMGGLLHDITKSLPFGTQTHGELVVFECDKPLLREVGNGILNHIISGGFLEPKYTVVYFVWDNIPLASVVKKGECKTPYKVRFEQLVCRVLDNVESSAPLVRIIPTLIVRSKEEAMAHYRTFLSQGKEGTVLKNPNAIWRDGTSKDQVKLKLEVVVDLKITGFIEGTGKFEGTLGAFQMESECGRLKVNVNGRSDAMRDEVWANREKYLGTIYAVKGNSVMSGEPASLFLPVAVEPRNDKTVADTLEQIREQFEAATR